MDISVIEKVIKHNGWELPSRKFNTGAFKVLSPEQLTQISATLPRIAPEGAKSIKELARRLSVSDISLKKVAIEEGMNPTQFKFGKRVALGLLQEQASQLTIVVNNSKLPPECASLQQVAKSLGVSDATIMKEAEEFGWTLKTYRFGPSGRTYGITPEQVKALRQSGRIQRVAKKQTK